MHHLGVNKPSGPPSHPSTLKQWIKATTMLLGDKSPDVRKAALGQCAIDHNASFVAVYIESLINLCVLSFFFHQELLRRCTTDPGVTPAPPSSPPSSPSLPQDTRPWLSSEPYKPYRRKRTPADPISISTMPSLEPLDPPKKRQQQQTSKRSPCKWR